VPASQASPFPPPSSRPRVGSCRGSSLSRVCAERSGGTRPPGAPLTGGFRGGRIARRGEDGPAGRAGAVSRGASRRGPADGGCGRTALRRRPAPPTLRQRVGPPPTSGETPASPALRGGTLDCPARPFGDSAPGARPGSACAARRTYALEPSRKGRKPGACSTKGYLAAHGTSGTGARTRGPSRGTCEEHGCPTPTDRGIGSRRPEAPLKGCQRGCHLGRPSGGRCRLRRRPCLTWDLGAGC
jgi:hypothetical protein